MSHRVKVRHYHHTPDLPSSQSLSMASSSSSSSPSSILQKRVFSRTIDHCPDDPEKGPADFIWYSFCLHGHYQSPAGTSAQAWYAECGSRRTYGYNVHGMCKPNEICVNGPQPPGTWTPPGYGPSTIIPHPAFARCVSHDYYVTLAQKGKEGATPSTVQTGFQAEPAKQYGFEATLTTEDSSQVVEARSLEMRPVRADGSATGGEQTCSECAQIDINYVPDGTARITVHVELKEATGVVLLYLTSVLVSGVSESFRVPNNTTTTF